MVNFRFNRSVLGFASCVLGLILLLPTSSWAISFALDAGIFGTKYSGDIFFTGSGTNLKFAPTQNVTYTDYDTSFLLAANTSSPFTSVNFTKSHGNIPLDNCGPTATLCRVGFSFRAVLDATSAPNYKMNIVSASQSRQWNGPSNSGNGFPASPMSPQVNDMFQFNTQQLRPVPEPGTIALLATGLLGLAGYRWSQRRREGTRVG